MLHSAIDHIVVTAPSLTQGIKDVEDALGVTLQAGGDHPQMGTHNALLKLGDELFLEVIAVDPHAAAPNRPRWFRLDEPDFNRRTRLATWVARTNDIQAATMACPLPPGDITPMIRGALRWQLTIPPDGGLPLHGLAPALIQWTTAHPGSNLKNAGCSLIALEAFLAAPAQLNQTLDAIGFDDLLTVTHVPEGVQPYLIVRIQTPGGPRQLGGQ